MHLKRARLLREVDSALDSSRHTNKVVKAEILDPTDVELEPLDEPGYCVGSKCRFRHSDGRWYNGQVIGLDGSNTAKISFLTPTSENMLVRKIHSSYIYLVNFYFPFLHSTFNDCGEEY